MEETKNSKDQKLLKFLKGCTGDLWDIVNVTIIWNLMRLS